MADNDSPLPPPVAPDGGRPPSTARLVIGTLLLVLGMVLTGGAGLCTGLFSLIFLFDGGSGPELSGEGMFIIPFIYGGPFILIGALLWWIGVVVRGKRRVKATPPPWAAPPPPTA
jgi:hypothetical protein